MALGRAVMLGGVASLAVPYVMRDDGGRLGELLQRGVVRFEIGGAPLLWSWPIFLAVTLLAWGLLAWSDR